ncbi:MAG UNVERIFIED_CONTAM: hypothetical protein LVT10_11795, partial [Anaerolineae bacterium]
GDLRSPLRLVDTHIQQSKLLVEIPGDALLDYKSLALPLVAPDVVVLGSSRVSAVSTSHVHRCNLL